MDLVLLVFGLVFLMLAAQNRRPDGKLHRPSQIAGFAFMILGIAVFVASVSGPLRPMEGMPVAEKPVMHQPAGSVKPQ